MTIPSSFRFKAIQDGSPRHVNVEVRVGPTPGHRALAGRLVLSHEEWAQLQEVLDLGQESPVQVEVQP